MNDDLSLLDLEAGQMLVTLARQSLERLVRDGQQFQPDLKALPESVRCLGASFVTLTDHGLLRGCMGNTDAVRPLAEDVARSAIAAASRDPRFHPVAPGELGRIRLEVTVLTPPHPMSYRDYPDLISQLRPGVDGVMLSWQGRKGLLLPQVWSRIPGADQFLEMITYKAGIPVKELFKIPPTVKAYTFQVQYFMEPGYQEPGD